MGEQALEKTHGGLPAGIGLGEGFEGLGEGDLQLSRAKIMQSSTEEFKKDSKAFTLGTVVDNITLKVLPGEFIPIMRFVNWICFNPRKKDDANFDPAYDPGKIIWKSSDPLDLKVLEQGSFGPNGELPKATKFINYLCVFPGERLPIIISFAKTSLKAGVKLLNIAVRLGGNIYDNKYRLTTSLVDGDQGSYFVYGIEAAGKADEQAIELAKAFKQHFGSIVKKVEESVVAAAEASVAEEEGASAAEGAGAAAPGAAEGIAAPGEAVPGAAEGAAA